MIEYPPIVLPKDLVGVINGNVPKPLLSQVQMPNASFQMHHTAARSWHAMCVVLYAATKVWLAASGVGRTFQVQYDEFFRRYTPTYIPGRNVLTSQRTYQGKRYFLRRGMFPCARPGESNHGLWIAVDLGLFQGSTKPLAYITSNGAVFQWLTDHATEYGWGWEGARVPPDWKPGDPAPAGWEPHHIRYVAGDAIPQQVLNVEAFLEAATKP
jgi:hypothetical protein